MAYFLFFFWLIVLSWLLTRIRFVKKSELGSTIVVAIFLCKVAAGVVSGWLLRNYINSDSWGYHRDALIEYHLLFSNPKEYISNFFYTGYTHGYDGIMQTQNTYWNDLRDNLIIKLISAFDIFSGGNYYVNVVLYNFTIFFGGIGLYRVFRSVYQGNKILTAVLVFLLPSVLFYGSALHKDGLIVALMGVIIFNCWKLLYMGISFKRILFIILAFVLIFFFRNYVVMALLPALAAWTISEKKKVSPVTVFTIVYVAGILLFFTIQYAFPSVNLQQYVVQKQADFFSLEKGNTFLATDTLQPYAMSFIKSAPQALQHSLLRPFITDVKLSKMLLPLSLELVFYEILVIVFLLYRKKNVSLNKPFTCFCLLFGLSVCLIIGYTVPVLGAIVRYRSIYLPFILSPFILGIDWNRLTTFAKIKK